MSDDRFIAATAAISALVAAALLGHFSKVKHIVHLGLPDAGATAAISAAPSAAPPDAGAPIVVQPTRFVVGSVGPGGTCFEGSFVLQERKALAEPPPEPHLARAVPMIPVECAHPQARISVAYAGPTAWATCICPKGEGKR